jgi:xanthine dehydrogenase small subunit
MRVLRPGTAAQAVRELARTPDALPLAGGTDLMVAWNLGDLNGRTMLDLSRIAEWTRLTRTKGAIRVGALATHTAIQRSVSMRRFLPLLVEACGTVGGVQIQNRGTLGGNVANASPAGDTFPPLAIYNALVHIVSAQGRRSVPFLELFAGPKLTRLAPGELIEAIEIPIPPRPPDRHVFRKVGTRAAQAISKVVAAGALWLNKDGSVGALRFALGSVAPTVRRLSGAEAFVAGKRLTADVIATAGALVEREIAPIDDIRSTRNYRLMVARQLFEQFLGPAARAGTASGPAG